MATVSTYLNFEKKTFEAFEFYKSIFGGEYSGGGVARFGDFPPAQGMPPLASEDKNLIMHIELPILNGHKLMGSDAPESMGYHVQFGNNIYISLDPDSRAETQRLFDGLSAGGKVTQSLEVMFWGALYGSCVDKFGVQWMFNCTAQ